LEFIRPVTPDRAGRRHDLIPPIGSRFLRRIAQEVWIAASLHRFTVEVDKTIIYIMNPSRFFLPCPTALAAALMLLASSSSHGANNQILARLPLLEAMADMER
jgi:hypothetical protein